MKTLYVIRRNNCKIIPGIILFTFLFISALIVQGQTIQTQQDGNWSESTTWVGGSLPGPGNNVIIAHNVNLNQDATIITLTINNGVTLTINPGIALQATGNTAINGNLIVSSSLAGTAAFIDNGTITGSGSSTIQRYINSHPGEASPINYSCEVCTNPPTLRGVYHFISCPVAGATLSQLQSSGCFLNSWQKIDPGQPTCSYNSVGLTGLYVNGTSCDVVSTIWEYNESHSTSYQDMNCWQAPTGSGEAMSPLKTFLLLSTPGSVLNYTGTPTTGSKSYPLTSTSGNGFNLIGNPYPSPIDWDAPTGWTKNSVDDALYFCYSRGNGYSAQYYSYINGFSNPNGTCSGIIPIGQGVFVHTPSSTSITVNNNARTITPGAMNWEFFKSGKEKSNYPVVRLRAFNNNSNNYDETTLYAYTGANVDFDPKLDALKLFNSYPMPNIYCKTLKDNLSIYALPAFSEEYSVQLGYKVSLNGKYTIYASEIANISDNIHVFLKDILLNNVQDLTINPVYKFDQNVKDADNRFIIYYSSVTNVNNILSDKNIKIYTNDNFLNIMVNSPKDIIANISVCDMLGREMVSRNSVNLNSLFSMQLNIPAACYIVKVQTSSSILTKKVIIQ